MSSEKLRILPLGGLGEIGMNCLVLEWMGEMVLVDCGVQFPDATYPGVDFLLPDLSYVRERFQGLRGVVVTHGHDDHIGGIPFLARHGAIDVYSTPFPRGLLQQKLEEHPESHEIRFHEIEPRRVFEVGPFRFDAIPVQHSIIEALGFAIETPMGTIVHSGDFKHDANEIAGHAIGFGPFEEYGRRGVQLLFSDSTNAERTGHTLSELDIARSFERIFAAQDGRLFIALFASNIRRIEHLLKMAHLAGKKVAFGGRSMHSYTRLAHEQGSLNIPPDTLILVENIQNYKDNEVVVLLTGSQAEPQSMLVRVASGQNKDLKLRPGDRVILSSRFIPGNERNITAMIDQLYRQGAEVIYESIHQIHVSGHGFQDELMMMLRATRPRCFVPIHGEYRHLAKHAKLARAAGVEPENIQIVEDGQMLELDREGLRRVAPVELLKGAIVEGQFMRGSAQLFSQRQHLAKTGVVFAVLMRDSRTLELVANPRIHSFGLLLKEGLEIVDVLNEAVDFLESVYPALAKKPDLEEGLRLELRRFFKKRACYKPITIPVVLDV